MDTDIADDIDTAEQLAELQATLKQREAKIKELNTELQEAHELVDELREHTEDNHRMIEQWIEAFEMSQDEHGNWTIETAVTKLLDQHSELLKAHQKLKAEWNKFVGEYNATVRPRERGRPLAASTSQQADVLKRHKGKASLKTIAAATSLSLRTVRTIIEKKERRDRTSKRTNDLRRKEFDKRRAADFRARKRMRDNLPSQIGEQLKTGAALVKAAKGLGRASR